MLAQRRKIVLVIDNHSSYVAEELSNVKLAYLPACTTSRLQPLDAGIIATFKLNYRKHVVQKWLQDLETSDAIQPISMKYAIYFIKLAWDKVKATTIHNCWLKTRLIDDNNKNADVTDSSVELNELAEFRAIFRTEIFGCFFSLQTLLFANYIFEVTRKPPPK
jgi:hypothetical protein